MTIPQLHPDAQAILAAAGSANRPPVYTQPLEEARTAFEQRTTSSAISHPVSDVRDVDIKVQGRTIPVRIYTPQPDGPLPILVYFHGGCWVFGNVRTHDSECRSLAARSGCIVVSVDYRLAPEHRFPAAVHDAYDATAWAAERADELGGDPTRLLVGGVSAGGNLAAAVTLLARDRADPAIAGQVLVYPIVDCDLDRGSYELFGEGYLLTKETMRWSWEQYAPEAPEDPLASPLRALDHSRLPPAYVLVTGCDPLRDEGLAYVDALRTAGVPVKLSLWEGHVHAFFSSPGRMDSADQAHEDVAEWIRHLVRRGGTS